MNEVSLLEMLAAREKRAERQAALLKHWGKTLISFTVNVPGPVKVFTGIPKAHEAGCARIEGALAAAGFPILEKKQICQKTGLETFYAVDGNPTEVKRLMVTLEDGGKLGRLLDIDVLSPDTQALSREQLGFPPRNCLLCGQPAKVCGRSRCHSVQQLTDKLKEILREEHLV